MQYAFKDFGIRQVTQLLQNKDDIAIRVPWSSHRLSNKVSMWSLFLVFLTNPLEVEFPEVLPHCNTSFVCVTVCWSMRLGAIFGIFRIILCDFPNLLVHLVAYKLHGPWRKRRSDFGRGSIRIKCQLFFVKMFRSQYWLALAMIVDEINDDLNWLILVQIQIDYTISRPDYNMYRIDLCNRRLYNEARVESLSKERLDRARIYDLLLWLAQLYLHRFRCWEQMTVSWCTLAYCWVL